MYESSRLFAEASKHAARDLLGLRAWHRLGFFCACSLLLALSACSSPQLLGSEEGAGDENEIVATDGAEPTVTLNDGGQCVLSSGPGVIRRLTKREYQKSLVSLFESTDFPFEEPLSGNIEEGGYSTRASGLWVRDLSAQAISIHAEAIAGWAVESVPERISLCRELTPSCVDEMLETFARRAFRMSLTDVMRERYSATLLGRSDWPDAARLLVSVAIQSPYFLYRRELGVAQGSEALLSADERAASLAYSLTANSPDAELQAAAASDTLNSEAQLLAEASRLLDTEGTVDALSAFVIEWLALEPVLTKTKTEGDIELSPELREAMLGEVRALVAAVYREGGGLSELLRRETVFVNGLLAAHYEIEGVSGDEFVEVPAGNRVGGLLGTAAYLISHSTVDSSSPTARGYFIRKRLLCLDVPPPPPSALLAKG